MLSDGTTNIVYGIGNERLQAVTAGTATWFTHDHLGSTRQTVTNSGTVAGSARYDAWGVPLENTTGSRVGFTGELTDNGLVYLRARWYNPNTGTFTSRDPFPGVDTVPQSLHPYAYTHNNPVNWTDPSGKCPWCVAIAVGAAIGAAVEYGSQVYGNYQERGWQGWDTLNPSDPWAIARAGLQGGIAGGLGYALGPAVAALPALARIGSPLARSIIAGSVVGALSDIGAHIAGNMAFGDAWCHGVGEAAFSGLLAGSVGGGIGWKNKYTAFYSAQGPEDVIRLLQNQGIPWPQGVRHGSIADIFGPGLYTFRTQQQAIAYMKRLHTKGAENIRIVEHWISAKHVAALRTADFTTMTEDAVNEIYNSGVEHGYEHIMRMTGNYGMEHFFRADVYSLFRNNLR
jgi:RHS repeat-associated protein